MTYDKQHLFHASKAVHREKGDIVGSEHDPGVNCLKASTDKMKQPTTGTTTGPTTGTSEKKKMRIATKNGRFKMSFSFLHTGEFRHKIYNEALIGLNM